jgi:hypothetical protein
MFHKFLALMTDSKNTNMQNQYKQKQNKKTWWLYSLQVNYTD